MPSTNGKPSRFELPQLTPINYSLTEGTGIPPPPDSPIEEYAPAPAPASSPAAKEEGGPASENSHTSNGQSATSTSDSAHVGRSRTDSASDAPPMSPASSTRPSSIRRFLSRKSLNTNYTNGTNTNASHEDLTARPESAMSFASQRPSLAKKKSGSWFKRLGSSNGVKRTSIIYEDKNTPDAPATPVKMGPPPPKLPELNQFKAGIANNDEGSLGAGDMFKDIK